MIWNQSPNKRWKLSIVKNGWDEYAQKYETSVQAFFVGLQEGYNSKYQRIPLVTHLIYKRTKKIQFSK